MAGYAISRRIITKYISDDLEMKWIEKTQRRMPEMRAAEIYYEHKGLVIQHHTIQSNSVHI